MDIIEYHETASPDYYPYLKYQSKRMRHNQTVAEAALWQQLRGNALGVKFRRQHALGDYIADFVSIKSQLVVEVDGEYHFTPAQHQYDTLRTESFKRMGFREIRFTNDEILTNIDKVVNAIKSSL